MEVIKVSSLTQLIIISIQMQNNIFKKTKKY